MPELSQWKILGKGAYNTAYLSADGKSVLKIQLDTSATDTPLRSVRLWNEINPDLPPPAAMVFTERGLGWTCPFVQGGQASDQEMSSALIEIFNRTGRIVADATGAKNFVRTPTGQIVCVDVGMALQMEKRESVLFRRHSVVSLDAWFKCRPNYKPFFEQCKLIYPETINTVKALIFIKNNRPDIFDVNFLTRDSTLVTKLACAYDSQDIHGAISLLDKQAALANSPPSPEKSEKEALNGERPMAQQASHENVTPSPVKAGKEILYEENPISLGSIKECCIEELNRYIASRGKVRHDFFEPSLITQIFRNEGLTRRKVESARELISLIEKGGSINEVRDHIKAHQNHDTLSKSSFSSGLESRLGKCMMIIDFAKSYLEISSTPIKGAF